ncbi:MAG: amidase [Planctomycetota bacterium]|nr:MAG: amidase [Planctomycetota bacterium]
MFIACDPEDVRAQARAATERWRAGTPRGPLDGVPVAIKDEVDLVPYPTTAGTRFFGRRPAARDATSVARLRAAGAVLLGKANMHEIGLGVTGLNPHHGTARNPCDPTRITGGSSSGSAAAVAAGFCPLALGCDGGGSIRIPAALCGVFGLKPTFGRVSEHGAAPICWSVAHIGPIAATARDLALGYLAMAGEDPLDPNTLGQPAPHLQGVGEGGLQGLRLGIYRPWFEDADAEVVARCRELLLALERAGAELRDVEIPELGMVRPVHAVTIALEMASSFALAYRQDRSRFGLDVRLLLALAYACEPTDYVHAQRLRRRICGRFQAALGEVDAIVTPSTAGVAPPVPEDALATGESNFETLDRLTRFMTAANLTGLPAITIPAGHAEGGMPVGLQAIGRAWQEHVLLRLAYAAEPAVERRRPAVHWPLLGEPAGS